MERKLLIDREFMNLTVPLPQDEQERLERSLLRDGCRNPVVTWRGVILDGHKRFRFCTYEEIDFEVTEMEFASRDEAVIWVCSKRIDQVDRKSPAFRYLVGKWYIAKKAVNKELRKIHWTGGGHAAPAEKERRLPDDIPYKNRHDSPWATSYRLGEEIGLGRSAVEGNGDYAKAMDVISNVEPALFEAIMREDVRFMRKEVIAMSKLDEKELGSIRRKTLGKTDVKMRRRNRMERTNSMFEQMELETPIVTGIKEMPVYDPDMELRGLALTIPSWINAMARA